jgi:hypothetical protein
MPDTAVAGRPFRVLLAWYTQSGQLGRIVEQVAAPLAGSADVEITRMEFRPATPYPFPWGYAAFFEAFPESVGEIPVPLEPLRLDPARRYDLVILGCQAWFLSPAPPLTSFLRAAGESGLLRGTPVVTVWGVRNMWIMAQESVKRRLSAAGARLVGNVVLQDPAPNMVSVVTILRWMLTGRREAFGGVFPPAGVPDAEITAAARFGTAILAAIRSGTFGGLQRALVDLGGVRVSPVLAFIERRARAIFGLWERFINTGGPPGSRSRARRVRLFSIYLPVAFLVAVPPVSLAAFLRYLVDPGGRRRTIADYSGVGRED